MTEEEKSEVFSVFKGIIPFQCNGLVNDLFSAKVV